MQCNVGILYSIPMRVLPVDWAFLFLCTIRGAVCSVRVFFIFSLLHTYFTMYLKRVGFKGAHISLQFSRCVKIVSVHQSYLNRKMVIKTSFLLTTWCENTIFVMFQIVAVKHSTVRNGCIRQARHRKSWESWSFAVEICGMRNLVSFPPP